jgi:hypothetical protein
MRHLFLFGLAWAVLALSGSPALALSPGEEARVEALLAALQQRDDVVFIRNGNEYDAARAASHLRLKFDHSKNRLGSAEEFIDKVASSSSLSGKPYMVREAGQAPRPAREFFHQLLERAAP